MAVKTYDNKENVRLQKNFRISEFKCKCGCSTTLHDDQLSAYLQQIREHFGKPVYITSGYRCEKHNASIKNASKTSRHMKGEAADFYIPGVKPAEIAKYAESIGVLGIGLYEAGDGNFVHIDTRQKKSFWYGHKQAYRATFGGTPIYTREKFLEELREALGAEEDEDLIRYTVTIGAKYNNNHPCIKPVQKWLAALDYEEVGEADGCAGAKFTSAMLHFQEDVGCTMTGIAEEWGRTWQELIAAERGAAQ